jgi:hypothetical protein
MPSPTPVNTRPVTSTPIVGAAPPTITPRVNSRNPPVSTTRGPWLSLYCPLRTSPTIFAARKPVSSQPNEPMPPRSLAAVGSTAMTAVSAKPMLANRTITPMRVARSCPVKDDRDAIEDTP